MNLSIALISEHASPLATSGGVDSGGQNVYVAQVASHLASMGHKVDVFTRRDGEEQPEVVKWRKGVRVIHVPVGPPAYLPKEQLLPHMPAFTEWVVDYARRRFAQKRGGGVVPEELVEEHLAAAREAEWILAVDQALERLRQIDPRMVKVVECRFFSGLTEPETADALGMSIRTVQRTWMRARAWLKEEMGGAP